MIAVTCLAGAFGLTTGLNAQTPTAEREAKAGTGKHTMTFTGCLREAVGTEGQFLLSKMPASAAANTENAATTYRVVSDGKVNLREHLGHKIEVTGQIAGGMSHGSAEHPSTPMKQTMQEPELTVTSVKQIAATCEPQPSK